MSEDAIIIQLIADTEISERKTTLAKSKLQSRPDSRTLSKVMGTLGAFVLTIAFRTFVCCDILSLCNITRKVFSMNKSKH